MIGQRICRVQSIEVGGGALMCEEAPKTTVSSLRAFFKAKNMEREGSTNNVKTEVGAEVDEPSPRKKFSADMKLIHNVGDVGVVQYWHL
ncbi:hypothetical protein HN51_052907 [Arachis hypogaea]